MQRSANSFTKKLWQLLSRPGVALRKRCGRPLVQSYTAGLAQELANGTCLFSV